MEDNKIIELFFQNGTKKRTRMSTASLFIIAKKKKVDNINIHQCMNNKNNWDENTNKI